jgi:hypothetical protein
LVEAFRKKWWVESDFKAPNLPLSLRLRAKKNPKTNKNKKTEQNNTKQNIKKHTHKYRK